MKLADAVQPPQEKPMDPHLALEKVLRLLRKHMNFDYTDPNRKVQYPPLINDSPPNEHLLRNFWRHCQIYYFRVPDQSQLTRLDYFWDLIHSQLSHEMPFRANQDFWKSMQGVFSQNYLQKQIQGQNKDLDTQNWLCTLYLYNRLLENQEGKPYKKVEKELNKINVAKQLLKPITNSRMFHNSLIEEKQELTKLLPAVHSQQDEVEEIIRELSNQLEESHSKTVELFNDLLIKIGEEEQQKAMIHCYADRYNQIQRKEEKSEDELLFRKISSVKNQLNYLQYTINKLEKKQIAESISKITKIQKNKGEVKFHVRFEEAMNVKKKTLTQQELLQLNKNREYSLFKFYNTSLKTPYSFICQNFLGFRQIHLERNKPCKYKNKNILQEMKKATNDSVEVAKAFEKFDICHHCKLLYPENFLIKCKYSSDKMGVPIQPPPYCDSYISQISKIETSKSQRYMVRRRNCFQNYTKNEDEYVCNRKFCKYCIRQNYEDGLDKNGLCPFCQGVCFCTRCSRNDMIVRLKSIYLLLGGQMSRFSEDKFLEYETHETDEEQTNSIRKKGRPKKILRRPASVPLKASDRKSVIRMQLQPLRLLCDMIKKRQKMKMRYYESQQQFFLEKLGFFSKQLIHASQNRPNRMNTDDMELTKLEKIRKRLNRMI